MAWLAYGWWEDEVRLEIESISSIKRTQGAIRRAKSVYKKNKIQMLENW